MQGWNNKQEETKKNHPKTKESLWVSYFPRSAGNSQTPVILFCLNDTFSTVQFICSRKDFKLRCCSQVRSDSWKQVWDSAGLWKFHIFSSFFLWVPTSLNAIVHDHFIAVFNVSLPSSLCLMWKMGSRPLGEHRLYCVDETKKPKMLSSVNFVARFLLRIAFWGASRVCEGTS